MGYDKSRLIVDGTPLAVRTASLLQLVVGTVIEVGPGVSGLPATSEQPGGEGPLVAIAEGGRVLRERGHTGSALVIACDLPFLSQRLLRFLVDYESPGSVVPVVRGRAQPLCAKWSRHDLDDAAQLARDGIRSLKHLTTQPNVALLEESAWQDVAAETQFSDVDTPADIERFGLKSSPG